MARDGCKTTPLETNAKKYLQRRVPTYKLIKDRRCGFKKFEHMKFQFLACKIKKSGKATGYQIAVKTSKKARYRIVMPTKKRTVVLRKLKASKVYYVKVRAFRTKGYRIVHGKFSKPIKIGKYKKTVKKPKPKATATPEPTVTPEATQIPESTVTPSETPSDASAALATPSEAPSDAPAP